LDEPFPMRGVEAPSPPASVPGVGRQARSGSPTRVVVGGVLLLVYAAPLFYPPPSFPTGYVVPPDSWLLQRIFPSVPALGVAARLAGLVCRPGSTSPLAAGASPRGGDPSVGCVPPRDRPRFTARRGRRRRVARLARHLPLRRAEKEPSHRTVRPESARHGR